MTTAYPGAIDAFNNPSSSDDLNTAGVLHDEQHANVNDATEAVETKLGTGASTPTTTGHVLKVTGAGATAYGALAGANVTNTPAGTIASTTVQAAIDELSGDDTAHAALTGTSAHGLGTMSTQAASAVAITGGSINNTSVGTTTAGIGLFTTLRASGAFSANGGLALSARAVSDADTTILVTDTCVKQTGTMTAPRTWTLPASILSSNHQVIFVWDMSGTVSTTNTLTIVRLGSNTIDGATSVVINAPYGGRAFYTDQLGLWHVLDAGSVLNSGSVALSKMADLAQDQFIGRVTASTGVPETATITAAARTVLDDTTVGAMVDTLGGGAAEGSGVLVRKTSPTLATPVLGVATATTINKVALTAPATGSTLTIADGKTLTANHSLTLAGTDSTVMTFPTTSATIARTDAANTFTGIQTMTSPAITTPTGILMSDIDDAMDTMIWFREEFMGNTIAGSNTWTSTATGTLATCQPNGTLVDKDHWGIARMNPGTDTTGVSALHAALATNFKLGAGGLLVCDMMVYLSALSDATNTYTIWCGFGDQFTSTEHAHQLGFKYSHGLGSGNWQGISATAIGTQTLASGGTGVPVTAAAWWKLRMTDDGTTSTFYANGTNIGTTAATRPTGVMGPVLKILKSAGATQPLFYVDYFRIRKVSAR